MSQVESIEKKFSTVCPGSQCAASFSYAQAASTPPDPHVNVASPSPARLSSVKATSVTVPRACNLVLFGLPENNSIMELKSEIDELLEFLAGKQVNVNDVFRLGKYSGSSKRPRPVLIKLATAWDRKVVLLRKRSLKEFKIPRLFLREDVPPDHKLRQNVFHVPPKDDAEKPPSAPTCSAPSILLTSSISDSQLVRSGSPALPQSTSDPPDPHTSSSSTTTVTQGPAVTHNGST